MRTGAAYQTSGTSQGVPLSNVGVVPYNYANPKDWGCVSDKWDKSRSSSKQRRSGSIQLC